MPPLDLQVIGQPPCNRGPSRRHGVAAFAGEPAATGGLPIPVLPYDGQGNT